MKKQLYCAWKKAVIVKYLDKFIRFKSFGNKITSNAGKKKGVIKLINIGHGFLVVKL